MPIKISTITITCSFPVIFNLENVAKYIDLKPKGIISISYGEKKECNRMINIQTSKKKKKVKPKKKKFYNQATCIVNLKYDSNINVKIFGNGSLQLTGCKNTAQFVSTLDILFFELHKRKAIIDLSTDKIIKKPFCNNMAKFTLEYLHSFNIRMINSTFHIGFQIDRFSLFELLQERGIECSYEPLVHACVNIKFYYNKMKKISIFVFKKGSIIITGANSCDQILESYNFICKILYENYNKIYSTECLINDLIMMEIK